MPERAWRAARSAVAANFVNTTARIRLAPVVGTACKGPKLVGVRLAPRIGLRPVEPVELDAVGVESPEQIVEGTVLQHKDVLCIFSLAFEGSMRNTFERLRPRRRHAHIDVPRRRRAGRRPERSLGANP